MFIYPVVNVHTKGKLTISLSKLCFVFKYQLLLNVSTTIPTILSYNFKNLDCFIVFLQDNFSVLFDDGRNCERNLK